VLAIVAEHSFYLWDQAPSDNDAYLISAINIYELSAKHTIVIDAVDKVFEGVGHLFDEAKGSEYPWESAFAERLTQIVLDNRLCMYHVLYISLLYLIHTF
jgi:hypothetical protein